MPAQGCQGRSLTPCLIDCHSHGGHREMEFELPLNGVSYEEIARADAGIRSLPRQPVPPPRLTCWPLPSPGPI
jgi:imidazolonepropionase-like amidohydrolase